MKEFLWDPQDVADAIRERFPEVTEIRYTYDQTWWLDMPKMVDILEFEVNGYTFHLDNPYAWHVHVVGWEEKEEEIEDEYVRDMWQEIEMMLN